MLAEKSAKNSKTLINGVHYLSDRLRIGYMDGYMKEPDIKKIIKKMHSIRLSYRMLMEKPIQFEQSQKYTYWAMQVNCLVKLHEALQSVLERRLNGTPEQTSIFPENLPEKSIEKDFD